MNDVVRFQKQILAANNIEKIVWIDDFFSKNQSKDSLTAQIIDNVKARVDVEDMSLVNSCDVINDIIYDSNEVIWRAELVEKLSALDEGNLAGISEKLEIQGNEGVSLIAVKKALENAANLETFSQKSWAKTKDKYLINNEKTLFIVDLDFSEEGLKEEFGLEIISEIFDAEFNEANCILFTHTCANDNQAEDKRIEYKDKLNEKCKIKSHMFSVMSKGSLTRKSISVENRLAVTLMTIFLRKVCSLITDGLKENMVNGLEKACHELENRNVYELEKSIFKNSLKEGASEIDVIYRLLSLAQESATHDFIINNPNYLNRLKILRNIAKQNSFEIKDKKFSKDYFNKLRNQEIWMNESTINLIHSPLQSGDVFKSKDSSYIFLAQPCDISLREEGQRNPYEGTLFKLDNNDEVLLKNLTNKEITRERDKEETKESTYIIENCYDSKKYDIIRFDTGIHVNLNILDWCVFNASGCVSFSKLDNLVEMVFLPGWIKKHEELLASFNETNGNELPALCSYFSSSYLPFQRKGDKKTFEPKFDNNTDKWDTNLKRIRRLRDPYAEHALMKYFSFKSRKAFAHNFA
ncbi:MAG: hypothetical protein COB24_12635 [Hyphomicrobiales bacterium]|nr:MAG: hypothetical protein COB24_12635 [Hyphomicrobiales bacterium]